MTFMLSVLKFVVCYGLFQISKACQQRQGKWKAPSILWTSILKWQRIIFQLPHKAGRLKTSCGQIWLRNLMPLGYPISLYTCLEEGLDRFHISCKKAAKICSQ